LQTLFTSVSKFKQTYEDLLQKNFLMDSPSLSQLREDSMGRLESHGFPNKKIKGWDYKSTAILLKEDYVFGQKVVSDRLRSQLFNLLKYFDKKASRVIFVNGHFCEELSNLPSQLGVKVYSLKSLLSGEGSKQLCQKIEDLWKLEESDRGEAFTWLNSALCLDGCVISVENDTNVESSIEVIHIQAGDLAQWQASMCRNYFFIGEGAKINITEGFVGLLGSKSFSNTVTCLRVEASAKVNYFKVQLEDKNSYHMSYTRTHIGERAQLNHLFFGSGAKFSRQELHSETGGPEAFMRADAIYLVQDDENMDMRTFINHPYKCGSSHQLFKGIAAGRSRVVFSGNIFIGEGAQKVDASQVNKTLLLSQSAEVDASPELEIYADDVKATHGATVGYLDEEQIFYLASRGISGTEAKILLAQGFAREVFDNYFNVAPIVKTLAERVEWWVKENRPSFEGDK